MSTAGDDEVSDRPKVPAPTSLDELQDMPAEDFDRVERYQWGDSASVARVLDHIIELAAQELTWRGTENANSLRDFWYNPTKPIVERAFPSSDRLDDRLSTRLSALVEEGRVSYRELNILDDSRKRDLYTSSPESDRILFVEKRAAYRKLKPLAEVYEITLVSGGGQASTAMIEDMVHQLRYGGTGGAPESGYEVFVLSDYDPSGFAITESFVERCRTLGLPIASVERIGISPDHLPDEEVARQRFKPPIESDNDRAWIDEYGIDGRYGLELEAVGDRSEKGEALRRMVVEAIGNRIRTDERRQRDVRKATETIAPKAAGDIADSLVDDIRTRLRNEADELLETRYELHPDAYDAAELHEGAITGDRPAVNIASECAAVKETLRDRIASGEIQIDGPLGDDGSGGERR